jgi:hypothetical protein
LRANFLSRLRVTGASVEPPSCHTDFKTAWKPQKDEKVLWECRNFGGCHAKIWLLSKCHCQTGKSGHASCPLSTWMKNPSSIDPDNIVPQVNVMVDKAFRVITNLVIVLCHVQLRQNLLHYHI